ncbi:MAG: 4-(cytidine 5'-diphospho)-2-C-methyl-D-erythritol kinase [Rhodobacteraceae bacterium]|uniref:4-(cytidine 5'-diphospho)-2-C-methyl-D-erythritol kinase n=1 Tax=Salipiger thiooxidans TaxID=282683 RepID=UPI001A8FE72E|nr:4-(cytidine 5'-diphospho)-2-C-methyl-D-erythritol kinase [Salipiger thiooxidans]MBN8185529.1 4-(cytidine 5'-diphospho)-2-C-methyl-D-erythritol kinase [Salipiger thiooxidans]MBR9837105.1 4-(cytidine 5'-diphospho)-2-C-methyl-D-erythritol kinase [Paracoccaceae bacterium]
MANRVFAPAKINLTLHVTGRRSDGYHLLDSLVSFAPVGDWLTVATGEGLTLEVSGPEAAGVPDDMSNLALRAAALLAGHEGAALTLEKNLPAASGIGGGSADAAAALRGIATLSREIPQGFLELPDLLMQRHAERILGLGADVPMCVLSHPLRARGIGERLGLVTLPDVAAVLVNPRLPVPTPAVFKALETRENPPMPDTLPEFPDAAALIGFLARMRNDLEAPALKVEPGIRAVLDALAGQGGCGLARMSGSGATCFGLFLSEDDATAAAQALTEAHPGWWVASGVLGDCSELALPRPQ